MKSTIHPEVFDAVTKMVKTLVAKNPNRSAAELKEYAKDLVRCECLADTIQIFNIVWGKR